MFDNLILYIKENVYGIKISDLKELTPFRIIWFCIYLIAVLGIFISPVSKYMLRFSLYIFAVALLLIYHFYLKYKRFKRPDQFRDRYFNRIICRLAVPFKDPKSNMYSEQKIEKIIEICDDMLKENSFSSKINHIFRVYILPFLSFLLTLLMQSFSRDEIRTFLSEYGMNMLYLVFIYSLLFCGIGLIINGFLMARKDVYRVMKRDLEYLLLLIR